jgi:nitrogen fixation/metabolism regulation signal transduction histidine kinase
VELVGGEDTDLALRLRKVTRLAFAPEVVIDASARRGYHENYLMARHVPFEALVETLTAFLVTRQVFAGAGKVLRTRLGNHYYLSQRAQHIYQEISGATEDLVEFLTFVSIFFVGIAVVFARGMGRMIISPVKKLLAGTREVSLGNLEIAVVHRSHDEMKTLVDGFNAMVENLKKHQQEIAELSKKAAWAEMAQKVAHEIKNPLTPIQLSAEHILRVYEDKRGDFDNALRESASYIISEVENLRRIAQEFLQLSREAALKKERFDLRDLIREVATPYQKMLSQRVRLREVY